MDIESIKEFNKFRPQDTNICAVVSAKDGKKKNIYIYHSRSAINTVSKKLVDKRSTKPKQIIKRVTRSLNNIIENTNQNEYDEDKSNQKKLLEKYKIYIEKNKIKLDIKELDSLKIGQLVKFITMVSPFSDSEKQMCLETKNIIDFAEKLISILDIYSKNSEENKTIN